MDISSQYNLFGSVKTTLNLRHSEKKPASLGYNRMKHFSFTFLFLIFFLNTSFSQLCSGNKGLNIFTDGNFGSGTNNIYQFNPGIAPGYTYAFNPPVLDGQYCLTNGTFGWTAINGWAWIRNGDDSPDPEGYMLLFNASYDTGLFYQELVTGLCENSIFEFTARIINVCTPGSNQIKPNVSFLIDGVPVYNTGDIPEDGSWNTYGFTFTTAPGQTQVTLALRNNAPGGIGNDLAIDNIKFRACGPKAEILPTQVAFACEDSSDVLLDATITGSQYNTPKYQWQRSFTGGNSWNDLPGDTFATFTHTDKSGGAYYYRYLLANSVANLNNQKCRIVSNEKVVRVTPKFSTFRDTICDGLSKDFGLNTYVSTGNYTDSLVTFFGCDSIVTLSLRVMPDNGIETKMKLTPPKCKGTEDAEVLFEDVFDGYGPYSILVDSVPVQNNRVQGLGTGIHNVQISDRFGCTADTTFVIEDPEEFEIDLGPKVAINLGDSVEIKPQSNFSIVNYDWQTEFSFECDSNCSILKMLPRWDTYIGLRAQTSNDCIDADSVFIEVLEKRDIFIPNIFTPNNDGYNDQFSLQASFPNVVKIKTLKIFDRWENVIFEVDDLSLNNEDISWDGRYNGNEVPSGVYYYFYEIEYLDGKIEKFTGYTHLLR